MLKPEELEGRMRNRIKKEEAATLADFDSVAEGTSPDCEGIEKFKLGVAYTEEELMIIFNLRWPQLKPLLANRFEYKTGHKTVGMNSINTFIFTNDKKGKLLVPDDNKLESTDNPNVGNLGTGDIDERMEAGV